MCYMGQKLGVVYTIITILFFAILAVIFVLRLNVTRDENLNQASATVQLVRQTAQEAFTNKSVTPQRFRDAMRGIIKNDPAIQLLTVYSYTGGTEYLWARNPSLLPSKGTDVSKTVGIPDFQYNDLTSAKISDSFDGSDGRNYLVAGVFTVIGNSDVYPLIRDSLVLTLLYAMVTLLIMVLLMVTHKREEEVPLEHSPEPVFRHVTEAETADEQFRAPVNAGMMSSVAPEPITEDAQEPQPRSDGVISRRTGISYRNHLDRRLTLELERAAFNEQDLSVAQIRFPGISAEPALYGQAANLVLAHYAFEDLTFEFDTETFFVILPNTELNVGIKSAEAFQRKAAPFVRQHRLPPVQIGLSSRNGRLTDGPQILKEARQAVAKAGEDSSSRIVGFHPDPQRYRAFIAGKDGSPD